MATNALDSWVNNHLWLQWLIANPGNPVWITDQLLIEYIAGKPIQYTLSCDCGEFGLTGQDAWLLAEGDYYLSCEEGLSTLTGQAAGLVVARVMLCSYGKGQLKGGTYDEPVVIFGDSITNGYMASDDAHEFPNIIASNQGYTEYYQKGANGSILQNTNQNTVAVIGSAASVNGRDTYVSRVLQYNPSRVFILYGAAGGLPCPSHHQY
jgi:hypothetical protein